MAAPVITSIDVTYENGLDYKLPGRPAIIVVNTLDPDSHIIDLVLGVADGSGTRTEGTYQLVQHDPLTFDATASEGHTVTQDPLQPNKFYVT